jgi:hypothetical protein
MPIAIGIVTEKGSRTTEWQNYRTTKLQNYRTTELQIRGPVGLSPPLIFILAGNSKLEERKKKRKNRRTKD